MGLIHGNRLRHAGLASRKRPVTLTIDGFDGHGAAKAPRSCAPRWKPASQIPKLCATDMVDAFGSCRLCLVEIEGRNGTPPPARRRSPQGMVVHTQTDRLKQIRKGVMELYISDHPLDCLTCAANGDCELQDMAGAVGLRDVRYGYEGDNHVKARRRRRRQRPLDAEGRDATPISPMTRRNASSARAACGPARKCRAPSR